MCDAHALKPPQVRISTCCTYVYILYVRVRTMRYRSIKTQTFHSFFQSPSRNRSFLCWLFFPWPLVFINCLLWQNYPQDSRESALPRRATASELICHNSEEEIGDINPFFPPPPFFATSYLIVKKFLDTWECKVSYATHTTVNFDVETWSAGLIFSSHQANSFQSLYVYGVLSCLFFLHFFASYLVKKNFSEHLWTGKVVFHGHDCGFWRGNFLCMLTSTHPAEHAIPFFFFYPACVPNSMEISWFSNGFLWMLIGKFTQDCGDHSETVHQLHLTIWTITINQSIHPSQLSSTIPSRNRIAGNWAVLLLSHNSSKPNSQRGTQWRRTKATREEFSFDVGDVRRTVRKSQCPLPRRSRVRCRWKQRSPENWVVKWSPGKSGWQWPRAGVRHTRREWRRLRRLLPWRRMHPFRWPCWRIMNEGNVWRRCWRIARRSCHGDWRRRMPWWNGWSRMLILLGMIWSEHRTDWLIGELVDWCYGWPIHWLIDWLITLK